MSCFSATLSLIFLIPRIIQRNVKMSSCKGKGKVHRCTGTEALYRPYGP